MKKINLKQIERIIKLQKEINQKEIVLKNLVNNLTKKKLRILVYKLLLEEKNV